MFTRQISQLFTRNVTVTNDDGTTATKAVYTTVNWDVKLPFSDDGKPLTLEQYITAIKEDCGGDEITVPGLHKSDGSSVVISGLAATVLRGYDLYKRQIASPNTGSGIWSGLMEKYPKTVGKTSPLKMQQTLLMNADEEGWPSLKEAKAILKAAKESEATGQGSSCKWEVCTAEQKRSRGHVDSRIVVVKAKPTEPPTTPESTPPTSTEDTAQS